MKKFPVIQVLLIILGTILYFFANLQRVAVPGAVFTLLERDLNTTAQNIASLGASFMYVYALSQLFVGVLIARYGGFRVVSACSVLFFIGSLMFPLSNSMPLLYLSRILIGIGSAGFYLAMINETKKVVSHKNFGIALSFLLLIGYLGGIVANAPIVICINKLGWRKVFVLTAIAATIVSFAFLIVNKFMNKPPVDKSVKFNVSLFKNVLTNKRNLNLYLFACLNYGLYYVVQTVIGKKFLEDYCFMSSVNSALVLSLMGLMYAFSGSVIAFFSKISLNRRTIFLKLASINTFITFSVIFLLVLFNVRFFYVPAFLFISIAFWASLSPLLVPLLHDINGEKFSGSAISVMTAGFYVAVGFLGNFSGFCLDYFKNGSFFGLNVDGAYFAIFLFCAFLSSLALLGVFKIEESAKTKRTLNYVKNHIKFSDAKETHWHDKYEHDLYTNV